ncbi:AGAP001141-PB [Anopheles gambiae str. PEST]|uniref:AGAP001141-PB n=1 Tax=Anopheles gambiae TaxID=7165 RepID=F5HMY6_ANOGA|nr:AGAP001141-PB [Anopheles gambiae str. PEST]
MSKTKMAPVAGVTLHLECWRDELSPAQTAAYEKAEKEHHEVRNKLKEIVQETGGKNIFAGQVFTAYQVLGPVPGLEQISKPVTALSRKKMPSMPPALAPLGSSSSPEPSASFRRRSRKADSPAGENPEPVVDIASDDPDEDYIPLAKRMKQKAKEKTTPVPAKKTREEKVKTPDPKIKSPKTPGLTPKVAAISVRPTEFNSIGGLQVGAEKDKKRSAAEPSAVVDLTKDDSGKPTADSREISFSKIQGKTFPSLVVLARPSLRVVDKAVTDRPQLDAKVKNVLVHPAPKFTEWLIQQGLIKSEQTCQIHNDKPLKLGMYSDTSKFPYSGGYFWISDCCPTRFTSVFHGSLFEGSPHPPSVILKLIYHWACQTNVSNVVNWVKVDNMYLKGLYTLLRSVCTLALCRHMKLLGGPKKSIEIGVISLGTTTQDGQQRQVKVEVLGVLDPEAKILRLRAVEPLLDAEKSYKKRFSKILEPLSDWVHKDSVILTDLTVDKGTLNSMGYKTVIQVPGSEQTLKNSNANIMDYLRRIVPRMFQNTLSLLSRQIIQQFLNELVWRELYGNSPGTTFDNIVKHLSEEAKIETKESLTTRLHKAAADPFKQWEIVSDMPALGKVPGKRGRKPKDQSIIKSEAPPNDTILATPSPTHQNAPKKIILKKVKNEEERAAASASTPPAGSQVKKIEMKRTEKKDYTVQLESYYYGCSGGTELKESALACTDFAVPCPECPDLTFRSNVELLDHLLQHASPAVASNADGGATVQCRTCLEHVADQEEEKHKMLSHPQETKSLLCKTCSCLICEQRFSTVSVLVTHLQKSHHPLEMPYRCGGCDYRSSILRTTIEHFYEQHKGSALLQCPVCLQICCAYRTGDEGPLMKNVHQFLAHLRKHTDKAISKRCNKCALSFLDKGEQKFHSIFGHVPNKADETVKSVTSSATVIPKPPKKVTINKEHSTYRVVKRFTKLVLNLKSGSICCECGNDFDQFNHMIARVQCITCAYQTACLPSMVNHAVSCQTATSTKEKRSAVNMMDQELHCRCGFSSYDGYALARHLIACDRYGAVYSTVEAAQASVVERSMLDSLGLIRRDGDDDDEDSTAAAGEQTTSSQDDDAGPSSSSTNLNVSFSHEETVGASSADVNEGSVSGVAYDPSQSLYNIAGAGEQQFNTQLSFDDLGPPSVLPAQDNNDRTPQLKDDYQSLATPRVPEQQDY